MKGIGLTEAINNGFGVWIVPTRDEVVKLQRKLSATAAQKGVKVKSRSYVSVDQSEEKPEVFYTVTVTTL
jgi:hypothetical protein